MSTRSKATEAVRRSLKDLGSVADRAVAADDAVLDDLGPALDAFRRAVVTAAPPEPENFASAYEGISTYPQIVGGNLRRLREEAGITQSRVADAMSRLGFDWKRITVTQAEAATRRLSLEELFCLGALFGIPVLELLLPLDGENVELPEGGVQLPAATLRELLIGRGGRAGSGGLDWHVPVELVGIASGQDDIRPAVELWTQRGSGKGTKRKGT